MPKKDKDSGNQKVNELLDLLNKKYKKKVVTTLDDNEHTNVKQFVSTGSAILDVLCVNRKGGGFPVGRISTIEGQEQTGKSLLAAHACADTLRRGGTVIYIDKEHSVDRYFFKRIGVDDSKLIYCDELDTMEEVFDFIEQSIIAQRSIDKEGLFTIVWDSVAATPTKREMETGFEDQQYADAAKVIYKACRKLSKTVSDNNVALIAINQLKQKIAKPGERVFGDQFVAYGGGGLKYHASLRVVLRAAGKIKNKQNDVLGAYTEATVLKSKFGPALRKCHLNIYYSHGIDDSDAWLDKLKDYEVIKVKGGYFYWQEMFGDKGFQTEEWNNRLKDKEFKEKVKEKLIDSIVIDYDKVDVGELMLEGADPDSLMEVEAVADIIKED